MEASQILLTGRNTVVTGAARGIGKATALAFADLGANIAVCDMLDDELAATAAEIEARGVTVLAESFDVRDAARLDFGCGGSQFIVAHVAYSYVCP